MLIALLFDKDEFRLYSNGIQERSVMRDRSESAVTLAD